MAESIAAGEVWYLLDWLTGENVAVVLFFIGLAGLVMRKNMMISVLSISIMNAAIMLFFVTANSSPRHSAPMAADSVAHAADPVPQALMITSVVLGVAVTAILLVLVLDFYRQYSSLDWVVGQLRSQGRRDVAVAPGPVEPVDWQATLTAARDRLRSLWLRLRLGQQRGDGGH